MIRRRPAAAALLGLAIAGACAGTSRAAPPGWRATQTVKDANLTSSIVMFSAKAGLASADFLDTTTPELLRWNGRAWRPWKHQPHLGGQYCDECYGTIAGLAASSFRSVWVLKADVDSASHFTPLEKIKHWDGKKFRRVTQAGLPGTINNARLTMRGTQVWLSGTAFSDAYVEDSQPFVAHYVGGRSPHWSTTRIANLGSINGVTFRTAKDGWAVGSTNPLARGYSATAAAFLTRPGDAGSALIAHWNGRRWHRVRLPDVRGTLTSVSATAPDDAMAVGFSAPASDGGPTTPFAMHWDGTSWSAVPVPGSASWLHAVGGKAGEYWAAGATDAGVQTAMYYHWDGTAWSEVTGPAHGAAGANSFVVVTSVVPDPGGGFWSTGFAGDRTVTDCDEEGECFGQSDNIVGTQFFDHTH